MANKNIPSDHIKHYGQIFTPEYLVNLILDFTGYSGEKILRNHIIDNSCGDGAFLCCIAERYIKAYYESGKSDLTQLRNELSEYIHGIEKDPAAYEVCLENLNQITSLLRVGPVQWDVVCADAVLDKRFYGKMDYVVGNPPYVRVHNLNDSYPDVKKFTFTTNGMTDLYLAFFELGFNMLNKSGKLCYITPSSWLSSLAGSTLREYIYCRKNLKKLIDLGHFQPFKATTYTLISMFDNTQVQNTFDYYKFNKDTLAPEYQATLSYDDSYIKGSFYLAEPEVLHKLRSIKNNYTSAAVKVKNGFATLADSVFIRDFFPFEHFQIPVLKASTGQWHKAFFPYDRNGKPFCENEIFSNKDVKFFLESNKKHLLKNATPEEMPEWYLFGRTQAIKDVYSNKYAINTVIKDVDSIKLTQVPVGSGIYSGLYILTNASEKDLRRCICSQDFIDYLKTLKKYKSGGYYTISSQELEDYINFHFMSHSDLRSNSLF